MLGARRVRLLVNGRDWSDRIAALREQMDWVWVALDGDPLSQDVGAMMCFVEGGFVTQGGMVDGVRVTSPTAAQRHLSGAGPWDRTAIERAAALVLAALPPRFV